MSFDEQHMGDCAACNEYERERIRLVAEIERLRAELADADTAMAKIDAGWTNYREIAAEYFRGKDAAEAAEKGGEE